MTTEHWSRLRAKGMGPRGGGKGSLKGPLRKVVRHRKLYTVSANTTLTEVSWRDWQILLETEDRMVAEQRRETERKTGKWAEVRLTESGWREVLECGHDQAPVQDLVGETNAVRRRCSKCKASKPPTAPVESPK